VCMRCQRRERISSAATKAEVARATAAAGQMERKAWGNGEAGSEYLHIVLQDRYLWRRG